MILALSIALASGPVATSASVPQEPVAVIVSASGTGFELFGGWHPIYGGQVCVGGEHEEIATLRRGGRRLLVKTVVREYGCSEVRGPGANPGFRTDMASSSGRLIATVPTEISTRRSVLRRGAWHRLSEDYRVGFIARVSLRWRGDGKVTPVTGARLPFCGFFFPCPFGTVFVGAQDQAVFWGSLDLAGVPGRMAIPRGQRGTVTRYVMI